MTGQPALRLLTCVGTEDDLALLPHFLAHYAGLGVAPGRTHVVLHARDPAAPGLAEGRAICDAAGTAEPREWIGAYTSAAMWAQRRRLQAEVAAPEDWVLSADVDEFHLWPAPLAEIVALAERLGARIVQGPMLDRIAADGRLAPVEPDRSPFETFPLTCDAGIALGRMAGAGDGTGTVKAMLLRGDVSLAMGGHAAQGAEPADYLFGVQMGDLPGVKHADLRALAPFRVAHFKWTAGLAEGLARRVATPGASPIGSRYGRRVLDALEAGGGRLPAEALTPLPAEPDLPWDRRAFLMRRHGQDVAAARRRRRRAAPKEGDRGAGWRVRQLTFGSADRQHHMHSYYDLPVLDPSAARAVAIRMPFEASPKEIDNEVTVGIVDVEEGGFRPLGATRAWSWQQGPMAQWLPGGRVIWNVRDDEDRLFARSAAPDGGAPKDHPRTVYAVDPAGRFYLSLNMPRIYVARPAYGYRGTGAKAGRSYTKSDGVWRVDLRTGRETLLLSLAQAREMVLDALPEEGRRRHVRNRQLYWFNHVKIAPGGARFTVKVRWRALDLSTPFHGPNTLSLTCGVDGSAPRVLARGTSHVIWHDARRLYWWSQADGSMMTAEDGGGPPEPFLPGRIEGNVHMRHVPADPRRLIYDTPYQPVVSLREIDLRSGRDAHVATFRRHRPPSGPLRCDLHPVPSADGRRVVVTSLQDGGRQVYVAERTG